VLRGQYRKDLTVLLLSLGGLLGCLEFNVTVRVPCSAVVVRDSAAAADTVLRWRIAGCVGNS
jgi:hypothetical protein